MKQFSHSKLQTYERCPLQYKFQYLTNLKPEKDDTIEAFMGTRVHETLELLYKDLLKTKLNTLDDLLLFYENVWLVEWKDSIMINNKDYNKKHYFDLGKKCIKNYYDQYYPFDQDQTLGIEKNIKMKWGEYEITGYIDRLAREEKGVYSIHDYKTGSLMDQSHADKDRQLALYSIAIKENYKNVKEVKLIWHYVAYGEDVLSLRTDKELKDLKNSVLKLIKEINAAEEKDIFPANDNKCDWCGYWQYCPKKKHLHKIKELPPNEYLKDDGVKLVNKYTELAKRKSEINKQAKTEVVVVEEEMEKVRDAILKYARKNKIETLQGDNSTVVINKTKDYSFPTKLGDLERYNEMENLLRKTKYWNEISSINAAKLEHLLKTNNLNNQLKNKIIKLAPLQEEISISIKKNKD